MDISDDFKKRCKEIYPVCKELHTALESNGQTASIGFCLYNGIRQSQLTSDDILNASSLKELQERVTAEIKPKEELYKEWCRMH